MGKRLALDTIKQRLLDINKNIEILSNEYINNRTKLKCRCLKDNYIWHVTWNMLQRGEGCPICGGSMKLNIDIIKERLSKINSNLIILDTEYKDNKSKLKCRCLIDEYEWSASWNTLSKGTGCPLCSGNAKKSLDEIKIKLYKINPNIKILSTEFVNIKSKLKCMCLINSDHIWEASAKNLLNNHGCPFCNNDRRKSKNPNWKGGLTSITEYLRDTVNNWRKESFESSNYECIITQKHSHNLVVHHLYNFNLIVKEIFKKLNIPAKEFMSDYTENELMGIEDMCIKLHNKYGLGCVLLAEIHSLFHNEYGYKNNTKEQFQDFIKRLESGVFNSYMSEHNLSLNINYKIINTIL